MTSLHWQEGLDVETGVGFIGIGRMGLPIARNLLKAAVPLWVWNRHPHKARPLCAAGARLAEDLDTVFRESALVLVMVIDEAAVDEVLARGQSAFAARVAGRTIVQLGTTDPEFSRTLQEDIAAAGGRYVEAPVSGSRVPAEQGRLIGMLAGDPADVATVQRLLANACASLFECGAVPAAMRMKLAVNHVLIGTVAMLAEALHAAQAAGLDQTLLRRILDAGPLASDVSRGKLRQIVERDFSPQAAIGDVRTIVTLVARQCARAQAEAPLIHRCRALFAHAADAGLGHLDMAAVVQTFDADFFPSPPREPYP